MSSQRRPHVGAYIKVVLPDRALNLPFGLVGQVVGHGAAPDQIHVQFPTLLAEIDYRTARSLGAREVGHALGQAVPRVVST